ncbi:helix-turn-helix domain-containing protein [Streptomyces sp. NPDC005355]|uniref:helix-turn-helix domain-containing protein n=1 Tax=Streptomyces sp. NPDC005355 TaxID=3157038 RepID=UPI0033AC18DE
MSVPMSRKRSADSVVRTASAQPKDAISLEQLLAQLGSGFLEVVRAPAGLDRRVRTAVIWDVANPVHIGRDDIIFAVGVSGDSPGLVQLIEMAAKAEASAVVLKGLEQHEWARAVADRADVAVLVAPPDLAWEHLHAQVRAAVATGHAFRTDHEGTVSIGDLFALADAAAADLGGEVEIDDASMHVQAFSTRGGEIDELRRASILCRYPPQSFMEWLRGSGAMGKIRESLRPVRLDPPGQCPRLVSAIRAGIDVLGYIWVVQGTRPFAPDAEAALTEIARIAAAQIVRTKAVEDVDRRLRAQCLRGVLEGTGLASLLAARLGACDGERFRVLAFRPRGGWSGDRAERLFVHGLVALRAEMGERRGTAVAAGDHIYALIPDTSSGEASTSLAQEIVTLTANQLDVRLVAGMSALIDSLDALPAARTQVDRIVRLLVSTDEPDIASPDELRPRAVLAEIRELAHERPQLLQGSIDVLRELDEKRNTNYIATLLAYFDAACDLTEAAKLLYVHRNTLRYRLQRIQQLSGLNLDDPVERLVAELQLRLSLGD